MGVDGDFTIIIREIIQFLESLYDVELPSKIENVRLNLLEKSRAKLSTIATNSSRVSNSPEPYLDMNAGKGLLLFTKKKNRDVEIEEYVGVEEQPEVSEVSSHQDYYETFQGINVNDNDINDENTDCRKVENSWEKLRSRDEEMENKLRDIYRKFTAAKTTSKAHKCGSLYHKVERKPFGFVRGNTRNCWVGLVGSHLLIHGSEDDKQPPEVVSIRGYSARPAANSLSRDQERAKSSFEIFCPGNKTLQFVAKNPKEMEEWLKVINRICPMTRQVEEEKLEDKTNMADENSMEREFTEEKYQDVGETMEKLKNSPNLPNEDGNRLVNDKKYDATRNSMICLSSPPLLPVRTSPRRLPSLPNEEIIGEPYEPLNDGYEEDDIYHKIEDFRDKGRSYENVKKSKSEKNKFLKRRKKKQKEEQPRKVETYDDVENKNKAIISMENNETYDDVCSSIEDKKNVCIASNNSSSVNDNSLDNYDDVSQSSAPKINRSRGKTKIADFKVAKSPKNPTESEKNLAKVDKNSGKHEKTGGKPSHKRSFLDRVRRKDSPKKDEKKSSKESMIDVKKSENNENDVLSSESSIKIVGKMENSSSGRDLPTYDDVSGLSRESTISPGENSRTTDISIQTDDISNYNCPPPPRPIYSEPPSPVLVSTIKINEISSLNEIYDDIGDYRDKIHDKHVLSMKHENASKCNNIEEETVKNRVKTNDDDPINVIENSASLIEDAKNASLDCEHYQIPRGVRVDLSIVEKREEELYDDIAILEDFRARQRDSSSTSGTPKKTNRTSIAEVSEKTTFPTRRPWTRFGSGKKFSSRESSSSRASATAKNKSSYDDPDDSSLDDVFPPVEKPDAVKMNKLQKFINKVEFTLGKQPSGKSVAPIFNKSQNSE